MKKKLYDDEHNDIDGIVGKLQNQKCILMNGKHEEEDDDHDDDDDDDDEEKDNDDDDGHNVEAL